MSLEDLPVTVDGEVSRGDILHDGRPHHGETLLALQRLRDLLIMMGHGDGLLQVDGPLHLHVDLLVAVISVGEWHENKSIEEYTDLFCFLIKAIGIQYRN